MIPESFERTARLIGEEAVTRLSEARVGVFGIGGVGSYAAEALARGGVGRLLLVDADVVERSNLNRQLHATEQTIGQPKAALMAERIRAINPEATVETRQMFCLPENLPDALRGEFDYLVDAVDTVSAKLFLAEWADGNGVPLISAMGAGNKMDPTRFRVADVFGTSVCPLCRVMRRELKKRGVPSLKVVYSDEPPLTPEVGEPSGPPEEGSRKTPPGSISFVPSVAGLIAAGEVIRDLIGWPGRG